MLSLKQGHVRIGTSALEGALAGQVGSFEEGRTSSPLVGRQTLGAFSVIPIGLF